MRQKTRFALSTSFVFTKKRFFFCWKRFGLVLTKLHNYLTVYENFDSDTLTQPVLDWLELFSACIFVSVCGKIHRQMKSRWKADEKMIQYAYLIWLWQYFTCRMYTCVWNALIRNLTRCKYGFIQESNGVFITPKGISHKISFHNA